MTPLGLTIVEAGVKHVNDLVELFDAYRTFYGQASDRDRARSFLRDRITRKESVIFIAFDDAVERGTALGFTQLYPTFSSVSMKPLWILNDLYVAPPGRRRGVARALMQRARQLAVDTGSKGMILETAIDNVAAQALYESLRWKRDVDFYRYALDL